MFLFFLRLTFLIGLLTSCDSAQGFIEYQTEGNWLEQKSFFSKTPNQYPRFASSGKVKDLV